NWPVFQHDKHPISAGVKILGESEAFRPGLRDDEGVPHSIREMEARRLPATRYSRRMVAFVLAALTLCDCFRVSPLQTQQVLIAGFQPVAMNYQASPDHEIAAQDWQLDAVTTVEDLADTRL